MRFHRKGGKDGQPGIPGELYPEGYRHEKRELDGLLEAMREFRLRKGTILTHDETEFIAVDGGKIDVVPVWQWLLRYDEG